MRVHQSLHVEPKFFVEAMLPIRPREMTGIRPKRGDARKRAFCTLRILEPPLTTPKIDSFPSIIHPEPHPQSFEVTMKTASRTPRSSRYIDKVHSFDDHPKDLDVFLNRPRTGYVLTRLMNFLRSSPKPSSALRRNQWCYLSVSQSTWRLRVIKVPGP